MGAHPVAQGSAGEVIKENGSLGGKKKKKKFPERISCPYWKQVTRGHAHNHMHTHGYTAHSHADTQANVAAHTYTQSQKGVRMEQQLVSSNHSL